VCLVPYKVHCTVKRYRGRNGCHETQRFWPARFLQNSHGCRAPCRKWLKAALGARGQAGSWGRTHRYGRIRMGRWVCQPCRPLASRRGLLEVRSSLTQNRDRAPSLFCIHQGQMVLLHGVDQEDHRQTPEETIWTSAVEAAEGRLKVAKAAK